MLKVRLNKIILFLFWQPERCYFYFLFTYLILVDSPNNIGPRKETRVEAKYILLCSLIFE